MHLPESVIIQLLARPRSNRDPRLHIEAHIHISLEDFLLVHATELSAYPLSWVEITLLDTNGLVGDPHKVRSV